MKGDVLGKFFLPLRVKRLFKDETPCEYEENIKNVVILRKLLRESHCSKFSSKEINSILLAMLQVEPVLIFPSSKSVSYELLDTIQKINPTVRFYFESGLHSIQKLNEEYALNEGKDIKGQVMYYLTYSIDEVRAFLNKFDEIEGWINPNWTELQKFAFLYDYVRFHVPYDENFALLDKQQYDNTYNKGMMLNRSLRSLIHGRGVCLGQSIVLQELLARQGFFSVVDVSDKGHAWVIVKVNKKFYNVDVSNNNWVGKTIEQFRKSELCRAKYVTQFEGKDIEFSTMSKADFARAEFSTNCPVNLEDSMLNVRLSGGEEVKVAPIGDTNVGTVTFNRYAYLVNNSKNSGIKIVYSNVELSDYNSMVASGLKPQISDEVINLIFTTDENCRAKIAYQLNTNDNKSYDIALSGDLINNFYIFETFDNEKCVAIERSKLIITEFDEDCAIYCYDLYKIDFANNLCMKYQIKTDRDLKTYVSPHEKFVVAYKLFSNENLKDSIMHYKGYVGSVVEKCEKMFVRKLPEIQQYYQANSNKEKDKVLFK